MKTSLHKNLLETIFARSKADDAIVIKGQTDTANIRFANNSVTTSAKVKKAGYHIISIINKRVGSVAVDNIENIDEVEKALRQSEAIALQSEEAEDFYPLVEKNPHADEIANTFNLSVDIPENRSDKQLADRIYTLFQNLQEYNNSGYGEVKNDSLFIANSRGLAKEYEKSYAHLAITAKTQDFTKSTWHAQSGYTIESINAEEIVAQVQEDMKHQKKEIKKKAGRYTVILSPHALIDMVLYMFYMAAMRDSDEGRGVFSKFAKGELQGNLIGEKLFPEYITIYSDPYSSLIPTLPFLVTSTSSSYASVFDNGYDLKKAYWIKNGILKNLIATRKYAHDQKIEDFALFPYNFIMDGGAMTKEELIKSVDHGLYINSFWYIRMVDPITGLLTGLTRDGVYVIEDGKIIGAANNFRYNQSPVELLKNITGMSKSCLSIPREFDEQDDLFLAPYVRVENFNMSSVSDAI